VHGQRDPPRRPRRRRRLRHRRHRRHRRLTTTASTYYVLLPTPFFLPLLKARRGQRERNFGTVYCTFFSIHQSVSSPVKNLALKTPHFL